MYVNIIKMTTTKNKDYSISLFYIKCRFRLCTRIKETINFTCFLYKNTITYTTNHISTNRKTNNRIKLINFSLKTENNIYFVTNFFF